MTLTGHEPQAEQDTSAEGGTTSHAPRLTPRRLTAAGLAVAGACFGGLNLLAGGTDVALLVLTTILVLSAGVSLLPSRPAPAFGACVAVGICLGGPFFQPYTLHHLTHTDQYAAFALTFLVISAGVVAVVAGIVATVRPGEGSAPPWLARFVVFATGVSAGALLIGAIAPTGTDAVTGADAVTARVEMGPADFLQDTATVAVGTGLLLVDTGDYPHVIANGTWENGTARPGAEPGAPTIDDVAMDSGSVAIGPFGQRGTFQIYCPIHPGMDLHGGPPWCRSGCRGRSWSPGGGNAVTAGRERVSPRSGPRPLRRGARRLPKAHRPAMPPAARRAWAANPAAPRASGSPPRRGTPRA